LEEGNHIARCGEITKGDPLPQTLTETKEIHLWKMKHKKEKKRPVRPVETVV